MNNILLSINNLSVKINSRAVVDGVSFDIKRGEVFGLVGESGSGKSMTALSIGRLLPKGACMTGEILFDGRDIMKSSEGEMRSLRGKRVAYVFQDPASSLNPVFTIGYQLMETSPVKSGDEAMRRLKEVHISDPERIYRSYPHQLSGGMRQRIMIAMALMNSPELLILDEPTTALDVTIQNEILGLIEEIIGVEKVSALFISHDFGIISRMCDRVAVMNRGRIVEAGEAGSIIAAPREEYTKSLIEAVRALE